MMMTEKSIRGEVPIFHQNPYSIYYLPLPNKIKWLSKIRVQFQSQIIFNIAFLLLALSIALYIHNLLQSLCIVMLPV